MGEIVVAKEKTFYQYFKQNMEETGLPAPMSLFGTLSTATASIGAMTTYISTYGTSTTVSEMLLTLPGAAAGAGGGVVGFATAVSEGLLVVGALSAAFYVGACIGSLAVATGKKLSNGISIADCFASANRHGIQTDIWLRHILVRHPALLNPGSGKSKLRYPLASAYA